MTTTASLLLLCILLSPLVEVPPIVAVEQKSQDVPVKGAALVLVGAVSRTLALVRPDKLTGSVRNLSSGQAIAELPQPSEYFVGTIYQFRIAEVLKGNKLVQVEQTINVFVPGPGNSSDRVAPTSERKYLLQLSLLKDGAEKYEGMAVMDLTDPSFGKQQFDPQTTYFIIPDPHGAVPVTEKNKSLIESIRREASRQ